MNDIDYLRFEQKVLIDDGCWEWTGARASHGYGECFVTGKVRTAHRVAYELWVGTIPPGMWVLHRCDNRGCVRPDHLFLGTAKDNNRDMAAKGRHFKLRGTHCPQGHSYAGANLRLGAQGERLCRECRRVYERGLRARRRAG